MDDLISRQSVKDWLKRWDGYLDQDMIARMQYGVDHIPSVQPRKGKWIDMGTAIDDDTEVKCSECGEVLYWLSNFCPNCGADMREGDAE